MNTFDLKNFIECKQSNKAHTNEEINCFIKNLNNFSQDEITQWLKAVKKNSLNDDETSALTLAMAKSGEILSWEGLEPLVDKHSSGGIGDKITFLLVPLIAAYGINIPKLSGRGLGITGGTIDKLESISGLKTNLSIKEIKEQVKKINLAIASAGSNLTPADKKLYAIRDVTDTVDSIQLIASSIMSKKIACGANNIILDVKAGAGAFLKTKEKANELAQKMVSIGKSLNKNITAIISNMNQPLGHCIGNSLEVIEALEILSGKEVSDLVEITICLAIEAINLTRKDLNIEGMLRKLLLNGEALKKFEGMVICQGGNLKLGFQKAKHIEIIKSKSNGYINFIDAQTVGEIVHDLGAGRKTVSEQIDHSVGVRLFKKYNDKVCKDEPLFEIHAKSLEEAEKAKEKLLNAIKFGQTKQPELKLIYEIIR